MSISKHIQNQSGAIQMHGRFDFSCFKSFQTDYQALLSDPNIKIVDVDFTHITYLDSSALGMLMLLREKAEACGKTVRLAHCQGLPLEILEMAHFRRRFEFV